MVGAGPWGQQIARELGGVRAAGPPGRRQAQGAPRRYRGRDAYWWMDRLGHAGPLGRHAAGRASHPAAARTPCWRAAPATSTCPRSPPRVWVVHGRLLDVRGGVATFGGGLAGDPRRRQRRPVPGRRRRLRGGDRVCRADRAAAAPCGAVAEGPRTLDLAAGVAAVVWATGFRRDFSWLEAPVLDADGEPEHERGITAAPGLYFLGLRWQSRRSSSFIDGVAPDAEHVTEHLASRAALPAAA